MASVRKFVERAPRYTLRPTDNRMMRFAHEGEGGEVFATKIVDLSVSGLSFVVDRESSPFIYEMIKVEIPLPNGQQIAWWGKVVRMEEFADHKWYLKEEDFNDGAKVIVAVHFEQLPHAHVQRIKDALGPKFEELHNEKKKEAWKKLGALWADYTFQMLFYVAIIGAAAYLLWAISQPTDMYDAEKGSPWGQRMWFWETSEPISERGKGK